MLIKKHKIFVAIIILSFLIILIYGYNNHKDKNTLNREIVNTISHDNKDINNVMEMVIDSFNTTFNDCTLTDIWYEENKVSLLEGAIKKEYDAKEVIVILTNFKTGIKTHEALNTNSEYTNYQWMLIKSNVDDWQLVSQGY